MTRLLEQAVAEIEKLSATEQDALAAMILDEITDERRWDEAFGQSQDQLSSLAEKARKDIRAGRVKNLDMNEV